MAMPNAARTQPDLPEIVALARALERDAQRTPRELQERDSRLARDLPGDADDRAAMALAWLAAVEHEDEAVRSVHQRAETAMHFTGLLVALAAIILGTAATL